MRSCAGLAAASDLSLLVLGFPALLRAYFAQSLEPSTLAAEALIRAPAALVEVWAHPRLAVHCHRHDPEDAVAWRKRCADGANLFLKQVRRGRLFQASILLIVLHLDIEYLCVCSSIL